MGRNFLVLWVFLISVHVFLSMPTPLCAASDPDEVKEIKEKTPFQVIADVEDDALLRNHSDVNHSPRQTRIMSIKINNIIKKPAASELSRGDSLSVEYIYIPSWVMISGEARMDIMDGDRIEIWLKESKNGWISASGGNTVDHHTYVKHRTEPIPEPMIHKMGRNINAHRRVIFIGGFVIFIIFLGQMISKLLGSIQHEQFKD